MATHSERLGARLRVWRVAQGLSQEEMGRRLGVSGMLVYRWEHGRLRPNPRHALALQALTGDMLLGPVFLRRFYLARKQSGLSQRQLARALNLPHSQVARWETIPSVPRQATLARLAEVLGVSADWLIGDDEAKEEKEHGGQ